MSKTPKRLDHPVIAYLIGCFVIAIMIFVMGGVINHLAFSSHGPGLLIPVINKFKKQESAILKEVQLHKESEVHEHFHHYVDYPDTPEKTQETCFICHSKMPHKKEKAIRAMLNMHTEFFVCETCHLDNEKGESIAYKWYNPIEKNPVGTFFGTSYDPETGQLAQADDHISRIAPYFKKGETLESTLHMQDAPLAKDYINVRNQLTPEQREGVTKKFHVNVKPKGHECKACHSDKSILNFKELGFSEKRTIDIEHLNITGLITKYTEFYLPDLFKQAKEQNEEK
jgi:hypothetical protein